MTAFHLDGRRVLVTGASAGIGRAVAVVLAGLGARLTLAARDAGRLEETRSALAGEGHRCASFDLADADAIPGWIKSEAAAAGPFAGMVHCAGVHISRPVRSIDAAIFDNTMHVNLLSALMLARGFRQKGCHGEKAALVLVASLAALVGPPANVVYAASKGGIVAATKGLAAELLRDGIRVNAVAPGIVDAGMTDQSRSVLTPEQIDALLATHPMGFGAPEDVALPIAFLLSDAARWITGAVLPVDGGASAM